MHRNSKDKESVQGNVSSSSFLAVCHTVLIPNSIFSCSEDLKKANSAKTQSLQALKDENDKLTQELDNSHKGQNELVKVKQAYFLVMSKLNVRFDLLTLFCFYSSRRRTLISKVSWKRVKKGYFFPSFIFLYFNVNLPVNFTCKFHLLHCRFFPPTKPAT